MLTKFTKKKNIPVSLEEDDKNLENDVEISNKPKNSDIAISSIFSGLYCQYDFDCDQSYVSWLLSGVDEIPEPVIDSNSHIPRPTLTLRTIDELQKDASIPEDFIVASTSDTTNSNEDEGVVIL